MLQSQQSSSVSFDMNNDNEYEDIYEEHESGGEFDSLMNSNMFETHKISRV